MVIFTIIGFFHTPSSNNVNIHSLTNRFPDFHLSPILFLVPISCPIDVKRIPAAPALGIGALGNVVCLYLSISAIESLSEGSGFAATYAIIFQAFGTDLSILFRSDSFRIYSQQVYERND